MASITAWHGKTEAEHDTLSDAAAKTGYRFLSVSIYGDVAEPSYAAVMVKRPNIVAQRAWSSLTLAQFDDMSATQAKEGFGPVMLAAMGPAASPLFAVVFQPVATPPLTRTQLTASAFQDMNAKSAAQGLILQWAAAYGDPADPRYAGIWATNTRNTLWNADGVAEPAAAYQSRFDAQTSVWCRPAFVTLDPMQRYLSVFVDDEMEGGWIARHGMSASAYQHEFDAQARKGWFPACVQAAGRTKDTAVFAALFMASESRVGRQFTATGPATNADTAAAAIDTVIAKAMRDSPVRHASLAIVHGKQLVYARGYTMAEPDWPIVQPTDYFRIASVSKCLTSLAIFQLIETGKLMLSTPVQSVLGLKTPSGGAPVDPRFNLVTIQHLLEHKSGLVTDAFRNGPAVRDAFAAASQLIVLPVTVAQTDSFIATLGLVDNPGAVQTYNNCGYHLLGRVVAKLRGTTAAIDAYATSLLAPLGITRVRAVRSLLSSQASDEARYQAASLQVLQSQMAPAQPMVPNEYGSEQIEMLEGAGGFSAAATDLARLLAHLMNPVDNPALKRSTVTAMLSAGAALSAAGLKRAGYGFDQVSTSGGGVFYAQKGGILPTSSNVLQFSNDWGLVMQWGGGPTAATNWYPNYPAIMNIAHATDWGTMDLFPQFGMPSL